MNSKTSQIHASAAKPPLVHQAVSQDELIALIQQNFSKLSKRLQHLGRYIIDHPNHIAFGTIAAISEQAQVHPSSLIRFANAFGFSGFSDMQRLFKDKLLSEQNDYQTRIEAVKDDNSLHSEDAGLVLLKQICHANSQSLQDLATSINDQDLQLCKQILQQANTIHVQGVRRSFPVASYFSYLLSNMDMPVHLIDNLGAMQKQQQALIREHDAVVVISFFPYGQETSELARIAKQKNIPVVAFTDSAVSPLAELADLCFCVKEAQVHAFRSLNATMCLVQAVALHLVNE